VVGTKFFVVPAPPGGSPRHVQNRNVLLWLDPTAIGVKTGFTTKAGYCLVAAAKLHGTRMLSVVLGEPSGEDSFSDAAALLDFGFHSFVRAEVIDKGHELPPITVNGLPATAAPDRSVSAWVPADNVLQPTLEVRHEHVTPPLAVGDRVGSVVATLHGLVLGKAPLVVASAPPVSAQLAAPGSREALWRRGIDTVNGLAGDLYHAVFG